MSALEELATRLEAAMRPALERPWERAEEIDRCLAAMRQRLKDDASRYVPLDLQEEALRRFWTTRRIETFRDAVRLSFGATVPIGSQRHTVIEDDTCFDTLLRGVESYASIPRQFRRCYRGLLSGYFHYDPNGEKTTATGKNNWERLRIFLLRSATKIVDDAINPDWVDVLQLHPGLLSTDPCGSYGDALLDGDSTIVDDVCQRLAITETSWFHYGLVLSTVETAVRRSDRAFLDRTNRLLDLLTKNGIVRTTGLIRVLDRFAAVKPRQESPRLRDAAVEVLGSPWLERRRANWTIVSTEAREMVADWLKLEFVETFFSVLVEERAGDRRRLSFWKRYVRNIENVTFALGTNARESRAGDFERIRRRMEGLTVTLRDPVRANNAFIMRMGKVTVVEFATPSHACYFYDGAEPLPFDVSQAVVTRVDSANSLKHQSCRLKLRHHDGSHGFSRWEELFEDELRRQFRIEPQSTISWNTVEQKAALLKPALPPSAPPTLPPSSRDLPQAIDGAGEPSVAVRGMAPDALQSLGTRRLRGSLPPACGGSVISQRQSMGADRRRAPRCERGPAIVGVRLS